MPRGEGEDHERANREAEAQPVEWREFASIRRRPQEAVDGSAERPGGEIECGEAQERLRHVEDFRRLRPPGREGGDAVRQLGRITREMEPHQGDADGEDHHSANRARAHGDESTLDCAPRQDAISNGRRTKRLGDVLPEKAADLILRKRPGRPIHDAAEEACPRGARGLRYGP